MTKLCRICGLPEDEHHEFEAAMPEGCQCLPGEWSDTVTPICERYVGDGTCYCRTCEHDRVCHWAA